VFRLALALGMPVRELLGRIGSDELTEWMAFYQLEPFGDFRRARDTRPFTPEDFMPFIDKQPARNEASANVTRLKAMFAHRVKKHG